MRLRQYRSREVLFLGGWLFTDLLLLLTLLFFIGNVVPQPTKPSAPAQVLPRLELRYTPILLSIDPAGLWNNVPAAREALKREIRQQQVLYNRSVGLAVVKTGASDPAQIDFALAVSEKIYDVLRELGQEGFAFNRASYYQPLYTLYGKRSSAVMDVYLFTQ